MKQTEAKERFKLEKEISFLKEDIDLLANELWAIESEQIKIDPKFKLNTLQADSVKIKDMIDNGKLFFYLTEYDVKSK